MHLALTLALAMPQSAVVKHISQGVQEGAPAGLALASTDDFDGDGIRDFVVGIPDYDVFQFFGLTLQDMGRMEIRSGADGSLLFSYTDSSQVDALGASLEPRLGASVVGDMATTLLGFPRRPAFGLPGVGEVRTLVPIPFSTELGSLLIASAEDSSSFIDESFGAVLANIGDITGDGIPELAVGSPDGDRLFPNPFGSPFVSPDVGRVRLFEGATYNEIGRWSTFAVEGAQFGSAIIGIADVNGDGVRDMAVGAPGDDAGRVYIIDPTVSEGLGVLAELTGAATGDRFGASLASLGDLDGGGRDELLVGIPSRKVAPFVALQTGRVEAYDGEDYSLLWARNGSPFGYVGEVVAAADLDGDGLKSALLIDGVTIFDDPDQVRAFDGLTGVEEAGLDAWPARPGAALAAGLDTNLDGGEDFLVGLPELDNERGGQLCYGLFLGPGGGPGATARYLVDDDGPADFDSLAVAALVVSPGDTLEVNPGEYAATVITKPLKVMGLGNLISPALVESLVVDGASSTTVTGIETPKLAVRNVPGRAAFGDLTVDGETTEVSACNDVVIARSTLRALSDLSTPSVGQSALRVASSNLQLVSSKVSGADGTGTTNDGGIGVELVSGSNLWSMGSSLRGGDGAFGGAPILIAGGDGGDALRVGDGCTADVRGRT
ncbi:MAG: integrin alpha, partial [Planctomycetota bacterium]